MTEKRNNYGVFAALSGGAAVMLGAFAAHGLKGSLNEYQTGIWQTAVFYHMCHSLFLLFIASRHEHLLWAKRLLVTGVILFSGSLYLLALTDIKWLGAITPIGGVAFIVAWILTAKHYYCR